MLYMNSSLQKTMNTDKTIKSTSHQNCSSTSSSTYQQITNQGTSYSSSEFLNTRVTDFDETIKSKKDETREERELRNQEKEEWAKTLTMDDVHFNDTMTGMKDIKGLEIKNFVNKMLINFCRANNVKVKHGRESKNDCVKAIIACKKGESTVEKLQKSIKKRKSKGTKPLCLSKEGAL